MTNEQALEILIEHQEWRRGEDIDMLPPKVIGEAIDVAIECLTKSVKKRMKIEMMTGCTADYLGVDGVSEVDMTDEQRINTWRYIIFKLGLTDPKGDDLNQLIQFCLHQWGEWDYGKHRCECCGDTVDSAVWEI